MVTVLLMLAGFFLLIGIIILIAPFVAVLEFWYSDEKKMISGSFSWLHPLVARGEIDVEQQKVDLCFFNLFRIQQDLGSAEEEDDRQNVQTDKPQQSGNVRTATTPASDTTDTTTASAKVAQQSYHDSSGTQKESFKQRTVRQKSNYFTRLKHVGERLKSIVEHPIIFFMRQKIWRQAMFRWLLLLARIPAKLWPDITVRLHVEAHIQDPATTGKVYGYWTALAYALSLHTSRHINVVFVPVFDRELLDIQGVVRIRTSLLKLSGPLLYAGLNFPFLTTWRVWRAAKKHNKNKHAEAEQLNFPGAADY
jgi:hypothetical protein